MVEELISCYFLQTDLVSEPEVSSLVERIRVSTVHSIYSFLPCGYSLHHVLCMQSINRMANLKRAQYGKVDLDYVLGIGGFDLERFLSFIAFFGPSVFTSRTLSFIWLYALLVKGKETRVLKLSKLFKHTGMIHLQV